MGIPLSIRDDDVPGLTMQLSNPNTHELEGDIFSVYFVLSSTPYKSMTEWSVTPTDVTVQLGEASGLCTLQSTSMNCSRPYPRVHVCTESSDCPGGATCVQGIGIKRMSPVPYIIWTPQNWTSIIGTQFLAIDDNLVEGTIEIPLTVTTISDDKHYSNKQFSTFATIDDNDSSKIEVTSIDFERMLEVSNSSYAGFEGLQTKLQVSHTNPVLVPVAYVIEAVGDVQFTTSTDGTLLQPHGSLDTTYLLPDVSFRESANFAFCYERHRR